MSYYFDSIDTKLLLWFAEEAANDSVKTEVDVAKESVESSNITRDRSSGNEALLCKPTSGLNHIFIYCDCII